MSFLWLKIGVGIVFVLLSTAGILYALRHDITDASLDHFEITDIKDITTESFVLEASLFVNNPSDISIPIKKVEYTISLKDTGEEIGSGTIDPFTLEKNTITEIPFEQKINWVPTTQLLAQWATQEHVYMIVNGTVTLDVQALEGYELPFNEQVDIKEYTDQFIEEFISVPVVTDVGEEQQDTDLVPAL